MIDPQRRRQQRGWYFYDWANSAFSTTVATVFLGPYLTSLANDAADAGQPVTLLGLFNVAPGAYIAFVISLSVLLQVITMPIVGALADNARSKRRILGLTAFIGAAATMGLFFVQDSYQLGGVLFIIANVAFGCSVVVYNSFLPDIATPDERNGVSSRGWALGSAGHSQHHPSGLPVQPCRLHSCC
jgi:UMF1 family MFS transporter